MKRTVFWIAASILAALGLVLIFLLPGYSFSGLLACAAAALIVLYILLSALIRRFGRPVRWIRLALTVLLCCGLLISILTLIPIVRSGSGNSTVRCDYIVVLGAGLNGTEPSLILQQRLDAAFRYLTENPDTVCVVSGGMGAGESITEAACMYRVLTEKGIAPHRILMEENAATTWENIAFSLDLIESRTGVRPKTLGIVSNEFHLFRAELMAKQQGVTPVGIPAETAYITLRLNYFLREIAAVWKHIVFGGYIYG